VRVVPRALRPLLLVFAPRVWFGFSDPAGFLAAIQSTGFVLSHQDRELLQDW
jgi:hypothetical protein